ncbi:dihydrofolate reductase-like domain-containing protein [Aspergillus karnatakaensis]|uniref:dihydrofolate reductase family protein n=1 Tax=Aspergillus karnatakaensis TaxID=1810916 RepID=UPI003CCCCC51
MTDTTTTESRPFKTRLFFATSLDGFIARRNNDITWLTNPPKNSLHIQPTPAAYRQTPTFEEHISEVDFIIMGRVTYDVCLSFPDWPYPLDKRLVVLSRTLEGPVTDKGEDGGNQGPRQVRIAKSIELVEDVLRAQKAKMVYVDGGEVGREFLKRGWVDEMVVTRAPVLLGEGTALFGGTEGLEDVRFSLKGVDVIEDGMVSCYYVKTEAGTGGDA